MAIIKQYHKDTDTTYVCFLQALFVGNCRIKM